MLQLVAELALEIGLEGFARARHRSRSVHPAIAFFGYLLLGAAMGALSLWLFPASFIGSHTWRSLNLLLTPLLAGLVMSSVGRLRSRGKGAHTWLSTFMTGWGFAFGMAIVRYLWAKSW